MSRLIDADMVISIAVKENLARRTYLRYYG